MYIVKTLDDGSVDRYETLKEVYMNCEGIDVSEGLYEFTDDEGNIYDVEWIEKVKITRLFWIVKSMTQGQYKLVKRK